MESFAHTWGLEHGTCQLPRYADTQRGGSKGILQNCGTGGTNAQAAGGVCLKEGPNLVSLPAPARAEAFQGEDRLMACNLNDQRQSGKGIMRGKEELRSECAFRFQAETSDMKTTMTKRLSAGILCKNQRGIMRMERGGSITGVRAPGGLDLLGNSPILCLVLTLIIISKLKLSRCSFRRCCLSS